MRFRNLRKWQSPSQTVGLLFLAQRLEELLFDYSLDSHKPMALNAPFLCQEAILLIQDIEKDIIDAANLGHVLDELEASLANDVVAKSLLDTNASTYILKSADTPIKVKRIRLEVLSRTLEPFRYLKRAYELLEEAVISEKKKDIDTLLRLTVTTLINLGLNKQHLYNKTLDYFYLGNSPSISSNAQVSEFLDTIFPRTHDFDVFFICSSLIKEIADSAKSFKVKIVSELPVEHREFATKKSFVPKEGETYAQVEGVRTGDPFDARERAERRLDNLRDLFTLFSHKEQICWREETLIKQCCSARSVIIKNPKNSMDKGFDMKPKTASKELNRLIKGFSFSGPDFEKFNRISDFHGISVGNDVPENQLLNVWISLETLVPMVAASKVSNVATSSLPFMARNYIARLVERFSADLVRWNKYKTKEILGKLPNSKGLRLYQKSLNLLAIEDHQAIREELYSVLGDFHLLRFRAFKLSEMLRNPKNIEAALDAHADRVSWQIRRIYRTRNLIVHSGRTPKYIHTLIENGHDYLDQVMFEIISMSSGGYKVKTLEQAFELARIKYSEFRDELKRTQVFDGSNVSVLYKEVWSHA